MPSVLILGGGVAGMSAAHELGERGFQVTVLEYQPHYVGGKARSIDVPDTSINGSTPLPGEHGFRFFPGFYRHITDTMSRIPYTDPKTGRENTHGVKDNLTKVSRCMIARYDAPPLYALTEFPTSIADLKTIAYDLSVAFTKSKHGLDDKGAHAHMEKTGFLDDIEFFAERLWQIMTSCYDRRANEYERIGWWEYMDADNRSEEYQSLLVEGLTRSLVAAQAKTDNTKTCGDILLQLIYNTANPFIGADRVLNGPTNDAWLYPWYNYLTEKLNVVYKHNCTVTKLNCDLKAEKIVSVQYECEGAIETASADYYISAMPVERFDLLVVKDVLHLDPSLESIRTLAQQVQWMNGIQYYLSKNVDINDGHILLVDTPWSLTAISQVQFWKYFDLSTCWDGRAKGVLSVDISDWNTKVDIADPLTGVVTKKSAKECTPEEIKTEVWNQILKSLNVEGRTIIDPDTLVHTYLDHDIEMRHGVEHNREPLLVNKVRTWALRPESYTNIPNLFLASDYVKTFTDIATMEAANEAARRAVNNIVDHSGVQKPLCKVWNLHEPWIMAPMRHHDQKRYDQGLAWKSYVPWYLKIIIFIVKLIIKFFKLFK